MSDPQVTNYRMSGRIHIWGYSPGDRHFGSIHMSADDAGCDALLGLLDLCRSAKWPAKKVIDLTLFRPDQIDVTGFRGTRKQYRCLVLRSSHDFKKRHFTIETVQHEITIELGDGTLETFRSSIEDIKKGNGDYCIVTGSTEFWFWWYVE
jgi:hypothetical protein